MQDVDAVKVGKQPDAVRASLAAGERRDCSVPDPVVDASVKLVPTSLTMMVQSLSNRHSGSGLATSTKVRGAGAAGAAAAGLSGMFAARMVASAMSSSEHG